MSNQLKRWEILSKGKNKNIIDILLQNRGIKTEKNKKEFFAPLNPLNIPLKSLNINELEVKKAIKRIKQAKEKGEHVIVYGDYDADGITGTATMWETLHALEIDVLPHIPDRFSEGYGLNLESVKKLKEKDPELKLIITVDHGITVGAKVDELKKLGIDMIISDHHTIGKTKPKPLALIYTTQIGGSGLSWIFAREIVKQFKINNVKFRIEEKLQLAAIGTIADQLPLIGPNRSIVKFGLEELNNTKRPGLLTLFNESKLTGGTPVKKIGSYEVGFIIAPRINAMGRLKHGLESLRLLCTTNLVKAMEISKNIGETNTDRQKIVDEVVKHALGLSKGEVPNVIVLSHETYHEGVIGLAAAKLTEVFYRPAIVLSTKGEVSKASARSISGFNIIEAIRSLEGLYIEGGGHPMAAGFSIKTDMIGEFTKKINEYAKDLLTEEVLSRKLKIDCEIGFENINVDLVEKIKEFEPTGLGNSTPTFVSTGVEIIEVKSVGQKQNHLKLRLRHNLVTFDSIFFGGGENYSHLKSGEKADVAFNIEENVWNGNTSIQLKIKDIHPQEN